MEIKANIFIHSHFETDEPIDVEVFSVSGNDIPIGLLTEFQCPDWREEYFLDAVKETGGFPLDKPVRVCITLGFESEPIGSHWYIESLTRMTDETIKGEPDDIRND